MRKLAIALLFPLGLPAFYPDLLGLPRRPLAPGVLAFKDIRYAEGRAADAHKHELDIYAPREGKDSAVLVFVHGGFWSLGDRSGYQALGNRFAKSGIVVVIPSYRLMPAHRHPAQIEDVSAAFAWTVANIARYGGDPGRIYVGGHSSGGHLAALLAVDSRYLAQHGLSPRSIRGVVSLSGVYDVRAFLQFGLTPTARRDASPLEYVAAGAPPFLLAYCQFDYAGLARQARKFAAALREAGGAVQLVRIPRKNHVTEILSIWKDDDPTAAAVARFIR